MGKKALVACLIFAMALNLAALSGCGRSAKGEAMTRGEWVAMLAEEFALNDSENATPYYVDVSARDELFPAVQSLGDWKILTPFSGDTLDAAKPVTRQEAAATAAIAAGFQVTEGFDLEQAVEFASAEDILQQDNQPYITISEGRAAAKRAKEVYLNDPGRERMTVELNPGIADLRKFAALTLYTENGRLYCSLGGGSVSTDESGQTVAVIPWGGEHIVLRTGDTFIAPPTAEYPSNTAYKVTAIYDRGGTVTLAVQQPDLEDLFTTLDIHTVASANPDDIIWAQGVSAVGEGGAYTISLLSTAQENKPLLERSFTVQKGNYEKTWKNPTSSHLGNSPEANAFSRSNFVYADTPSLEDFSGGTETWEKRLFTENKFSAGYKITGKLTIQDISVIPDMQFFSGSGLDHASLCVQADMSAELTLEGTLSDQLKIASIPIIPITPLNLIVVSIDIYLYADASGSIQATARLNYNSKLEWQQDAGVRKAQDCSMDATLGVGADIGLGCDVAAALHVFGINVIDAGAKVGGEITAEAKVVGNCAQRIKDGVTALTYTESMKVDATLYAPIVTLYVGSERSLIKALFHVGGEWELLTKENTWSHPIMDQEWVFWQKTVRFDADGNEIHTGPLDGDFSQFAGTYRADLNDQMYTPEDQANYSMVYPDIILNEDGSLTGGYSFFDSVDLYPDVVPYLVDEGADGSFTCFLVEEWAEYDDFGEVVVGGGGVNYSIYPVGVSSDFSMADDTSKVRLTYTDGRGGVFYANYTKVD